MDAKEAIEIIKSIRIDTKDYYNKHKGFYPKEQEENDLVGIDLAISALEKVETLEAENAKGFTYCFPFRVNQKVWYITEWDKYSLQKNHVATIRKIHVDNGGISFSVLDGKNYHTFKLDDIGTNVFLNKKDWHNARMKKLAVKR